MRVVLGLLFIAATMAAQTQVLARKATCPGASSVRLYAELPATIGGSSQGVMVPVCLALGPGLAVDTSTTPPTLQLVPPVAPQQPYILAVQSIDLSTQAIPPGQETLTVSLTRPPVRDSAMMAFYVGSQPNATVDAQYTAPGSTVVITLPRGPFVAGDRVFLVYLAPAP